MYVAMPYMKDQNNNNDNNKEKIIHCNIIEVIVKVANKLI